MEVKEEIMQLNQSVRLLTYLKTTKMIFNFRYHFRAKMTLFILELSLWDPQQVNQQEWSLIPVLSTWPSLQYYVMMRQLVITSLKNMIHCQVVLLLEIKCTRDVKLWHTTCINLIQIKSCQRPLQNSHMVQPNFKVSSGKTIHASSH